MRYQVGDVVFVSLVGKVTRAEKSMYNDDIVYKVETVDEAEIVVVNEYHIAHAPKPEDFENEKNGLIDGKE